MGRVDVNCRFANSDLLVRGPLRRVSPTFSGANPTHMAHMNSNTRRFPLRTASLIPRKSREQARELLLRRSRQLLRPSKSFRYCFL
jgi:type II secretory pathway component PulK